MNRKDFEFFSAIALIFTASVIMQFVFHWPEWLQVIGAVAVIVPAMYVSIKRKWFV